MKLRGARSRHGVSGDGFMHFRRRRRRRPHRDKLQCVRSLTNGQFFSLFFFFSFSVCFSSPEKKRIEPLNSARFTPDRWHFGDTNKFGNVALTGGACKARRSHEDGLFFMVERGTQIALWETFFYRLDETKML